MIADALRLSVVLSLVTTVLLLGLGVPVAYALARSKWRYKPLIEAVIALPLVLPPTVLGFYLLVAMGHQGWLGRYWEGLFHRPLAFSFEGLVVASICYSLPFAVQPLQTTFQGIDPEWLEVAWTSGATRWQGFWWIVLPNSVRGLFSAAVLVFAHTMGEFGVVLMVGGNIPGSTRTVSIALYDLVESLQFQRAGWLALGLLAMSYGVLVAFYLFNRRVLRW